MVNNLPDKFTHPETAPSILYYTESGLPIHHERSEEETLHQWFGELGDLVTPEAPLDAIEDYDARLRAVAGVIGKNLLDDRHLRDLRRAMRDVAAISEFAVGAEGEQYEDVLYNARLLYDLTHDRAQEDYNAHQAAYYDTLTGIMNRDGLLKRLESVYGLVQPPSIKDLKVAGVEDPEGVRKQLAKQKIRKPFDGMFFFIDEANFKWINSFGMDIGDAALRYAAQEVQDLLRADDAITFARFGGDEFTMMMPTKPEDIPDSYYDEDGEPIELPIPESGAQVLRRIHSLQRMKIQSPQGDSAYKKARQKANYMKAEIEARNKDVKKYNQSVKDPSQRQDEVKLQAAVRMHGEGAARSEWFFINGEPISPLGHLVVQAAGVFRAQVSCWSDYEKAVRFAETKMKGAKDFVHEQMGGADRPS